MNDERVKPDFSSASKVFAREMMKHKQKPTIVEAFGWLVLEVFLVIFAGAAFCVVYNWIIPEIFIELPNLNVPQAIGLKLVASFGTGNIKSVRTSQSYEDNVSHFWYGIGALCMFMLIGFLIKQSI